MFSWKWSWRLSIGIICGIWIILGTSYNHTKWHSSQSIMLVAGFKYCSFHVMPSGGYYWNWKYCQGRLLVIILLFVIKMWIDIKGYYIKVDHESYICNDGHMTITRICLSWNCMCIVLIKTNMTMIWVTLWVSIVVCCIAIWRNCEINWLIC